MMIMMMINLMKKLVSLMQCL